MFIKQHVQVGVRLVVILAVAVVGVFTLSHHALAEGQTNQANALKVSPVRSDIQIKAGESQEVETIVTNLTDEPITIHPVTNDFIAGDERGTPALILDADKYAPTHSLKRFMQPMSDETIPAKESRSIKVTITVPKDAQAGGYFGAIRFAPASAAEGGQVNLSASVASLILMTVPGPATEQLNLTDFQIKQGEKSGSLFQTPDNLEVAFRFENKGNVQLAPFGQISVQKGNKVVYSKDFNQNPEQAKDMVLPDSARRWDIPLEKIDTFGHYKVTATFTYGSKNQSVQVERTFWVIPLAYIIGGAVGLVVLIALIIIVVFALRGYKKRVLRGGRGGGFRR